MDTAAIGGGAGNVLVNPKGRLGKQEFLQLLVAQLKNQDPMNPMKSQEFAAQLAQFSSVEQLVEVNDKLTGQSEYTAALAQAMNSSAAVGVLGRDVIAVGNAVQVRDGSATIDTDIGGMGGLATIRIYDEADRLVGEVELGSVHSGRQTLTIDGLGGTPDGAYRYELDVRNGEGDPVPTTGYVTGRVTGVKYDTEGPVLVIGGMTIPLGAVLEVSAN